MAEKMTIGIMQPYFLPYLPYWQLLNAVDKYVIYDDVNYIKGGFINRNTILLDGKERYIHLELHGASSFKLIKEIKVDCSPRIIRKNLNLVYHAYKKAEYFDKVYPLIEEIFTYADDNLASYLTNSIKLICDYLAIKTELILSSTIPKDNSLQGVEKVLAIARILQATDYLNAIGGQELYSKEIFAANKINLQFLQAGNIRYQQFTSDFKPNLSILDILMHCSTEQIQGFLGNYSLA